MPGLETIVMLLGSFVSKDIEDKQEAPNEHQPPQYRRCLTKMCRSV